MPWRAVHVPVPVTSFPSAQPVSSFLRHCRKEDDGKDAIGDWLDDWIQNLEDDTNLRIGDGTDCDIEMELER